VVDGDQDEDGRWLGLREAARAHGVASAEALRRRIRRGTWPGPHRRDNRGAVLVFVPSRLLGRVQPAALDVQGASGDVMVAGLRERIAHLEGRLAATEADRDRWHAEATRRRWPGLKAWWRRLWEGDGRGE
jgi:hypothetical protein